MPDEDQVEQRTQSQVCRRGLRGASGTIDDGAGKLPREGSEELIIQAEKKGWAAAAEGAKHSAREGSRRRRRPGQTLGSGLYRG